MVLCLGEPLGGFCDVSCHFIFVSSFCCCSSFVNVLNSHFIFDIIPHPSVDYRRVFLHPFATFCLAHRRVIRNTFTFNHFVIFLRERYGFEWAFFTHRLLLPYAPSRNFWHNLLLSRLPWEPAVIP